MRIHVYKKKQCFIRYILYIPLHPSFPFPPIETHFVFIVLFIISLMVFYSVFIIFVSNGKFLNSSIFFRMPIRTKTVRQRFAFKQIFELYYRFYFVIGFISLYLCLVASCNCSITVIQGKQTEEKTKRRNHSTLFWKCIFY